MERYAEYKDSGIDYLSQMPTHWKKYPLFAVARQNTVKNTGMACDNLLSLSYGKIVQKDIDTTFGLLPANFEGYQIVNLGYVVLRLTDLQNDKRSLRTGYVGETGIITSAYMALMPIKKLNSEYFSYLLHVLDLMKIYYGLGGGIRQSLSFDDVRRLAIVTPPLNEQEQIVAYLDRCTAEIDTLLADLARQAELLDTYKRELIANAVTHGLNKNATTVYSGVDWIDDVPSHWAVTKMKWMFEIVKRIYGKEDRDVLSITQRGLKVKDIENNEGQLAESYANYQVVNVNDFAMNSMDLLTGWVDCSPFEGVTSPDYRVFRFLPGKEQCHSYYKYLFQMCYKSRIFYRLGQGVSNLGRWRLQADQFLNMKLPQPPFSEQQEIAAFLDEKTAQVDVLIADIKTQIEKLKQYRQIVIHDAVTGKIKVTEG